MDFEREIARLRRECGEAYQVVAELARAAGLFESVAVTLVLDNLWAAAEGRARVHDEVLPFVAEPGPV